jgi:AcrR family transcriptional regulator
LEINLLKNKGKQSRSRQTIQTILDAAAQVLIVQGYSGATTNKIAEKSGFSVGTLYQYFENKEDVYRELVSHELGKIVAIVQEARVHDNLRNTLSSIITQILQVMGNDPMLVQALGQLTSGPFLEIRSAARVQTVAGVAALLQAHRDEITLPDLYLAADTLVSATEGFAVNANTNSYPASDLLEQGLRLQLAYLTMP